MTDPQPEHALRAVPTSCWLSVPAQLRRGRCSLFCFHRFYKLHERRCEPIAMTVPRKVMLPCPSLGCGLGTDPAELQGGGVA